MVSNFAIDGTLQPYLEAMIKNLPNGPKLVMQALAKNDKDDYNKENLSLESRVRRGELNYAVCWLEALGLVKFRTNGKAKNYTLTPLGREAFDKFEPLFYELTVE